MIEFIVIFGAVPLAFMVGWWVGHKFGVQTGIIEGCGRDMRDIQDVRARLLNPNMQHWWATTIAEEEAKLKAKKQARPQI